MISIIICNRDKDISPTLKKNISETIGTEYEIICINNSNNQYNIFQAYNLGITKAKYSIICFMHDDVLYHTINWGKKVMSYFQNPQIGMLGIAGPTFVSKYPGIWWGIENPNNRTYSTRQYNLDTNRLSLSEQHLTNNNPYNEYVSDVAALDGLFFCIPKNLFEKISFDEDFGGFHFYDIDISMQVNQLGYKCICIYDILIEHISVSNLSKEWILASRRFFDKWRKKLPFSVCHYDCRQIKKMEENNLQTMLNILSSNHIHFLKYFTISEMMGILYRHKKFVIKKILKKIC